MSSRSISRTECASVTSLADLLTTLRVAGLPERKRQELASAIRTTARALSRSRETIPANGRLLANRLKEIAPAAIGISRGRWNNVRCLLRTSLALVQPISPGRHRNDLSPEWLALSNKLARDRTRSRRRGCCAFCRREGSAQSRSQRKLSMNTSITLIARC